MSVSTVLESKNLQPAFQWLSDVSNVISVIPNVVKVEGNKRVELKFTRLFFFTFDSTFDISYNIVGERMVEYKLVDQKGNQIKIFFVEKDKDKLEILISYDGEKAWIVRKGLSKILEEIKKGLEKELSRAEIRSTAEDYSQKLGKISYISKIIMKSKLANTEVISIKEGGLVHYLESVISQYSKYPVIYVSGTGEATFRVLFINGELKGVYVMINENEYFNEESLNKLSGEFKVNIYVALSPQVLEVIK